MVDRTFSPAFVIVSAKNIAARAHEIYVERGYANSFDREEWLRAEHELKNPVLAERVFREMRRDGDDTSAWNRQVPRILH